MGSGGGSGAGGQGGVIEKGLESEKINKTMNTWFLNNDRRCDNETARYRDRHTTTKIT